jgi:hypothetical protein
VLATLAFSEPIQTPTGWTKISEKVFSKLYTGNKEETVAFYDLVGNAGSTGVEITRIDKKPLLAEVNYIPSFATSGSVVATLELNKTGVMLGT